jgi:hypothetical protein
LPYPFLGYAQSPKFAQSKEIERVDSENIAGLIREYINDMGKITLKDITGLIEKYIENSLLPQNIIGHFGNLPILSIETPDGEDIISKEKYKENVSVKLYDGTGKVVLMANAKVRGRGNTSWGQYPKKSYKVKFQTKQSLLGEHKDKEWVLLANYADKTSLRNDLALWMGRTLSNLDYTSSSHFVGVILNGQFKGLYQLLEQVKLSSYRVNVADNGFLMEFDRKASLDDVIFHIPSVSTPIVIKEWTADSLSEADYLYCSRFVQEVDSVLLGLGHLDEDNGYAKYIDVPSFVDWMLVNEIAKNNDAYLFASCYMSLRRGGKLKMGPLWDFDIAYGNINYNDNNLPEELWIGKRTWFKKLLTDRNFIQKTKERFNYFYANKESILDYIGTQSCTLRNPAYTNNLIWKTFGVYVWPNPVWYNTYEEEIEYLKQWVSVRLEWLKTYYEGLGS